MKSEIRKSFDRIKKRNSKGWGIIKIDQLPDDCPVLAVSEFASKGLAIFSLTELVLVPIEAINLIKNIK